jgi:hypothetical protein
MVAPGLPSFDTMFLETVKNADIYSDSDGAVAPVPDEIRW